MSNSYETITEQSKVDAFYAYAIPSFVGAADEMKRRADRDLMKLYRGPTEIETVLLCIAVPFFVFAFFASL